MNPPDVLAVLAGHRGPVLAEGSVYERLRRTPGVESDPEIGIGALVFTPATREGLAAIHRSYIAVAAEAGLPMLVLTDTWRASAPRVARSRWQGRDVNAANTAMLRGVAGEFTKTPVLVGGLLGPIGDAYDPTVALARTEAAHAHSVQARELAAAGVDLLAAQTLPALVGGARAGGRDGGDRAALHRLLRRPEQRHAARRHPARRGDRGTRRRSRYRPRP